MGSFNLLRTFLARTETKTHESPKCQELLWTLDTAHGLNILKNNLKNKYIKKLKPHNLALK